jgi:Cu/Ag efflux protein CusF
LRRLFLRISFIWKVRKMPSKRAPGKEASAIAASCLLIALTIVLLSGCGAKPQEKRYTITGEIISIDAPHKILMVKHGEIPGLMPAMTMGYQVGEPNQLEGLHPGDTITADLVVSENKGHLEKIKLVHSRDQKTAP